MWYLYEGYTNVIKDVKKDFEDSFKESHKVDEKKKQKMVYLKDYGKLF